MAKLENIWMKFFTDAGLSPNFSATYAMTFAENRIQLNMLPDLTKEYLREMGIVCLGDVILILRHAKSVHEKTMVDKALDMTKNESANKSTNGVKKTPITYNHDDLKRSPKYKNVTTDTNDIIKKRLDEIRIKTTKRKITSTDAAQTNDNAMKSVTASNDKLGISKFKKIHISQVSVRDSHVPTSENEKAKIRPTFGSVFSRLGSSEVEENAAKTESMEATSKNVFARLGDKDTSSVKRTSVVSAERPSQIEIRTKNSFRPDKIIIKSTLTNATSKGTMQADREILHVTQRLPMSKRKTVKFSPHVDCKVIERRPIKPAGTRSSLSNVVLDHIKPAVSRNVTKVSSPRINNKINIKSRLGVNPESIKISQFKPRNNSAMNGVFSRLGVSK